MSLVELNDLVYGESTDASVNIQRHLRKFYPRKTTFKPLEKIQIMIQGEQFVDMKNSSLRFTLIPDGANINWGTGSALNIINRCRVMSSSGQEISDSRKNNLFQKQALKLYQSAEYNQFVAPAWGASIGALTRNATNGDNNTYVIPMRHVSPFFDNDQLLPPAIAKDLIVEIYLEAVNQVGIAGALTDYDVVDPVLITDCVLATSDITQAIDSMTKTGLIYEFCDVVHAETNSEADRIDFVLPHSLSNALEGFVVSRDSADALDKAKDNFISLPIPDETDDAYAENKVVFRIGDVQLPQIEAVGGFEIYNMLLNARGQLHNSEALDFTMTYPDFLKTATTDGVYGCYFVNLRRSKLFGNSGREVSNQRNLICQFRRQLDGVATPVSVNDFFVKYIGRIHIKNGVIDVQR